MFRFKERALPFYFLIIMLIFLCRITSANAQVFETTFTGELAAPMDSPSGCTTDKDGNIYVTDEENDRVQKFSKDGQLMLKFGSDGNTDGKFKKPTGIAVDNDGNMYGNRPEYLTYTGLQ